MDKTFYTVIYKNYLNDPDGWMTTGKLRPLIFKKRETAQKYCNYNQVVCEVRVTAYDD